MKQRFLIMIALCLIPISIAGCSQKTTSYEDNVSSDDLSNLNSSEFESFEIEESDTASEEKNLSNVNSNPDTPETNNQTISEQPEYSNNETKPQNNYLPPSNTQSIEPPQHNESIEEMPPIEETSPAEKTPPATITSEENQVFQLVNQKRKENGFSELSYRNDIQNAANIRANEIISTFSHTRPNGSSCFTAINVNYYAIGENIASGQTSATEVMNAWMNSPGHRANILGSQFSGMAVSVVEYHGVRYWVQIFIG